MLFLMMMMMMMFLVAVTNQIFLLIAQFPASKRRYRKKLVIFLPFFWRQRFTWKVQQNFPTFQYFQSSHWQRSFWFKCFKGSHVRLHNACKINFLFCFSLLDWQKLRKFQSLWKIFFNRLNTVWKIIFTKESPLQLFGKYICQTKCMV